MTHEELIKYIDLSLKVAALSLSSLAIFQLFEIKRKRHIDMFWKIYDLYTSDIQKAARLNTILLRKIISEKIHAGITKEEIIQFYSTSYHLTADKAQKEIDRSAMNRIRFFNQIGQLLKKKIINKDMVFELIGLGLEHDYATIKIILETHRKDHNDPIMYSALEETYKQYIKWKKIKIKNG